MFKSNPVSPRHTTPTSNGHSANGSTPTEASPELHQRQLLCGITTADTDTRAHALDFLTPSDFPIYRPIAEAVWHLQESTTPEAIEARLIEQGETASAVAFKADILTTPEPSRDELVQLVNAVKYPKPNAKPPADEKRSQADIFVELANAEAEIFRDDSDQFFATITKANGGKFTYPLNSMAFRSWLSNRFYEIHRRVASSSSTVSAACDVLRGQHADEPTREVFTRIAATPNAIYYDLCDPTGRVVEITAQGWKVIAAAPVPFVRPRGMLPAPEPQRGGIVEQLRPCLNVGCDEDFHLLIAFLTGTLQPFGAKVLLGFAGEQGTGKSGTTKNLRNLIDPHKAPTRKQPKDDHDLIICGKNNAIPTFDNLSHLPQWMSDSFCRFSTGAGDATRQLYSDDDEVIFSIKRPVIFNAITDVATKPDLLDRLLLIELPPLPADERKTERELDRIFNEARPLVLGALFDAVAIGLKNLPTTKPRDLPRMADFAQWVEACAEGLGWDAEYFLGIYNTNRDDVIDTAANLSSVAQAVEILLQEKGVFLNTPPELFLALNKAAPDELRHARDWPEDATQMGRQLQRVAPVLRARGYEIERKKTNGARKWHLKFDPAKAKGAV